MTKKEAQTLKGILEGCPQTPKIQFAIAIVDKQIKYFDAMKGQLKEMWWEESERGKWF